jgi:hypothetical protein
MLLRFGAVRVLASLPWEREPHLERLAGASDGRDAVSLSRDHGLACRLVARNAKRAPDFSEHRLAPAHARRPDL